ncbi:MFS transporter [Pseudonocardia acaciae]|uniref:MFS transporter n=1 Tax=Pseudonocardia acaciae TaxID=551276 RepID=UPI000564CE7B|nr:MFS transporter [Pseudonocardia acaciae]
MNDEGRQPRLPREVWVLVGAAFLVAVGFGLVAPALPTFARSFDVGITAASLVISAFAVFRLGFAPVSGRLVNKLGERRVFLLGLAVVAASTGACALAQSYWQLLLFRALGGVGSTMFSVSSMSLLFRMAPPGARARASGVWSVGFLLGTVTGPLVGGGLVAVSLRAPFVVYAVALVVTAVVTGLLLRRSAPAGPDPDGDGSRRSELRDALRHPSYRAALLANFANGWAVFGVRVSLVPLFVVEALRQAPSWAGLALTVFAAGNGAALLVAGRWADRGGRKPPLLVGLVLTAVFTAWLGFTDSLALFLVAALAGGIGSGLLSPSMNASVADVIGPKGRGGPVLAGFQMVSDLGSIIGPVVAGAVAEASSYGAAFALTGAIPLLALAAWLRAPETLPTRVR